MVGNFSSIEYAVSDGLGRVTLNTPDRGNPIEAQGAKPSTQTGFGGGSGCVD